MAIRYDINLNYVCNERCVFCATDLTNNYRMLGRKPDALRCDLPDAAPWAARKAAALQAVDPN